MIAPANGEKKKIIGAHLITCSWGWKIWWHNTAISSTFRICVWSVQLFSGTILNMLCCVLDHSIAERNFQIALNVKVAVVPSYFFKAVLTISRWNASTPDYDFNPVKEVYFRKTFTQFHTFQAGLTWDLGRSLFKMTLYRHKRKSAWTPSLSQ